jgi:FKBP-type peptidyl-prolyl cis-trans isomerase
MIKQDNIHNMLGKLATAAVVIVMVVVAIYVFIYFKNLKNDLMINDIRIDVLKEGAGVAARVGDEVIVNYIGTLENGFEFDNSYKRGSAFPVTLGEGRVIKGWEKGLLGIKTGEKRKLTIPPTMAYGDREIPNLIPANSTLIFEVEAVEIHLHG